MRTLILEVRILSLQIAASCAITHITADGNTSSERSSLFTERTPEWLLVAGFSVFAVIVSKAWFLSGPTQHHTRELLRMDAADGQPVDLWWLSQCSGCLLLLVILVVTYRKRARDDGLVGTSDYASSAPELGRYVSRRPAYVPDCVWLNSAALGAVLESASSCLSWHGTNAEPVATPSVFVSGVEPETRSPSSDSTADHLAPAWEYESWKMDPSLDASTPCSVSSPNVELSASDSEAATNSTAYEQHWSTNAYERCDAYGQSILHDESAQSVHANPSTYHLELGNVFGENNVDALAAYDASAQAAGNAQAEELGKDPLMAPASECLPAPSSSCSLSTTGFELVVHENFERRCGAQANCNLSKQRVLANDAPFNVEGKLSMGLTDGGAMTVEIFYAAFQEEQTGGSDGCVWVLKKLGAATLNASRQSFSLTIPAEQLISSRSAIVATKRALAAAGDLRRLRLAADNPNSGFRTCIRAEITGVVGENIRTFHVHSPELHVCGRAYIRKLCNPVRCGAAVS